MTEIPIIEPRANNLNIDRSLPPKADSLKAKTSKNESQFKYWCYTCNNFTEDHIALLQSLKTSYHIFGKEIGKSGTPHLQGYLEFSKPMRLSTMTRKIKGVHFEQRKGSAEQAANYCRKESKDVYESGTISKPRQGERTDIDDFVDAMASNQPVNIILDYPQILAKYPKFVDSVRNFFTASRHHITPIIWIHGKTGTNKSRIAEAIALSEFPDEEPYYKIKDSPFWDMYKNQSAVIIDEYRSNSGLPYSDLLRLGDRYPLNVQVKGSSAIFNSKLLIITSSLTPYKCFRGIVDHDDHIAQLIRRITLCVNTAKEEVEPFIITKTTDLYTDFEEDHFVNETMYEQEQEDYFEKKLKNLLPAKYSSKILKNFKKPADTSEVFEEGKRGPIIY